MFSDNKDFYPTPKHLIDKMLNGINFRMVKTILEPSSGKGDIVDALMEIKKNGDKWNRSFSFDVDCIEPDSNLRHILKGKGYRLIHDDFLSFDSLKEYDLIVLNPPYSQGSKHLLKALELQRRNGGSVICLLNAETLKNQNTNERISLGNMLKEYNADIEYIKDAFIDAERKTGVEVALIKVQLPEVKRESFILNDLKKAGEQREYEFNPNDNQIAECDLFKAIVNQYKTEVEIGIRFIKEYFAMSPYIMSGFEKDDKTGKTIQSGGCILSLKIGNEVVSVNNYIREVRGKYWKALFDNPKFIGKLTENLRREYFNKISELMDYEFSLHNIYEIKLDMQKNVCKGIEESIVDLFDEFSVKHFYDESSTNILYYNGWKTNKSWVIGDKIIIPMNAYKRSYYSYSQYEPDRYDIVSKLQDIEKCFNYLDGGLTEAVDLKTSLSKAKNEGKTRNIELKYFNLTFFKKGTCHITFKNKELLKKFNIFGSQHKGWLPPSYGKKKYNEMSTEEKKVIDEFEGESSYNKVINNTDYYIYNPDSLPMLEESA